MDADCYGPLDGVTQFGHYEDAVWSFANGQTVSSSWDGSESKSAATVTVSEPSGQTWENIPAGGLWPVPPAGRGLGYLQSPPSSTETSTCAAAEIVRL